MHIKFGIALMLLGPVIGCAAEVVEGEPLEVEELSAALGSCQGRESELRDFAFWASTEIIQARSAFEADPYNELAGRYFGLYATRATLSSTMLKAAQRGRSSRLQFICQSEQHQACSDPSTVLYTVDTEHARTDGWRIWACGDRFWDDEYVRGTDSGYMGSQVGIMVHELAHLGGATWDSWMLNEALVRTEAIKYENRAFVPLIAETYRFYVMKQ